MEKVTISMDNGINNILFANIRFREICWNRKCISEEDLVVNVLKVPVAIVTIIHCAVEKWKYYFLYINFNKM